MNKITIDRSTLVSISMILLACLVLCQCSEDPPFDFGDDEESEVSETTQNVSGVTINPSDADALSRVLIIPDAQQRNGEPPPPSNTPTAPSIDGGTEEINSSNGSTPQLPLDYESAVDLAGCYIWIQGSRIYFDVPYNESSGRSGRITIPVGIPTNVGQGSFTVIYCVYNERDEVSNVIVTIIRVLELGTGTLQISLSWNNGTDVDLWVTDPSGTKIWWQRRFSETGGKLDWDDTSGFGPENIFWNEGAPDGTYKVEVHYFDSYGKGPSDYIVTVNARGLSQQFSGTLNQSGEKDSVVNISKQGDRITF